MVAGFSLTHPFTYSFRSLSLSTCRVPGMRLCRGVFELGQLSWKGGLALDPEPAMAPITAAEVHAPYQRMPAPLIWAQPAFLAGPLRPPAALLPPLCCLPLPGPCSFPPYSMATLVNVFTRTQGLPTCLRPSRPFPAPGSSQLQFRHQTGPQPVNPSSYELSLVGTTRLPHGLVGMVLFLFHRKRHPGTERFSNLPRDTQLVQGA